MRVLIGVINIVCGLFLLFYVWYSTQLVRRNKSLAELVDDMWQQRSTLRLDLYGADKRNVELRTALWAKEDKIVGLQTALLDAHRNADYHRNRQDIARLELDNRRLRVTRMREELEQSRRRMGR